ncbi:heterokaryon incompatibility protein-domain-containing protein [Stachybotrys elegans]|uniref:Heterokaryon incompatibility protein-domain-containing protein n=1 Tax=Stachybotrys elegans TaxID=80388 RepID=A0A8K0SNA8_9HYPO|nr:heterokaryon incompatibility protein-domain-containing protein [Stachybotrys elegans]
MDSICRSCLAIDFPRILEETDRLGRCRGPQKTDPPYWEDHGGINYWHESRGFKCLDVDVLHPSPNCRMCRLLESTRQSNHPAPYPRDIYFSPCHIGGWDPSAASEHGFCKISMGYERHTWGGAACLPKGRRGLGLPEIVSDTFLPSKALLWLEDCRRNHGAHCNSRADPIPDMKVIDCHNLVVVPAKPGVSWAALSYVWGDEIPIIPPGSSDLDLRDIPATVQHAIEVAKSLGFIYLWVDRYCIDHQDGAHKATQISRMDAIYRGADLTIVAATGSEPTHGLPGVGDKRRKRQQQVVELDSCIVFSQLPDPLDEIRESKWSTRGWTFQEAALSRRRLFFTEHQTVFECCEKSWAEGVGGLEYVGTPAPAYENQSPNLFRWFRKLPAMQDSEQVYLLEPSAYPNIDPIGYAIKQYSMRNLTLDSDSVNAFAGILGHFRSLQPQISHIFGIPYLKTSSPLDLVYYLSWSHEWGTSWRRRSCFPSWTWAGWAGEVAWECSCGETGIDAPRKAAGTRVRRLWFEKDGRVLPMHQLDMSDLAGHALSALSITLCLEVHVLPPSMFSLKTRPPLYDTLQVGNLGVSSCSLPPGCDFALLIELVGNGKWSCILLRCFGKGFTKGGPYYSLHDFGNFVMVVERLDGGLAQRVGSLVLLEEADPFDHDSLPWETIRIV